MLPSPRSAARTIVPGKRARAALFVALVVLVCLANAIWGVRGRSVELPAAPAARIACVSYAPYRKAGETPFDPTVIVSAERIEEDLAALSRRFDCVRTYSVGVGLDQVPAIARRHGMKVYLGIWLSRSEVDNAKEMARGIAVARENSDVVRAVVVGNEVLLRGELTQTALAADIRKVAAETGLPVTYADVWEFWLKYREVEKAVSFVTIHILPYWEDEPVSIDEAIAHVATIRARMQATFPDRMILIGETGWPSRGRERRGAIPSLVNQARFIREFLAWADREHVAYNVIEAFDQPWKRQLEGTVGGYWGLYDATLTEKFPLSGPVLEDVHWTRGVAAGGVGALVLLGLAFLWRAGRAGVLVAFLCGDAIGATLYAEVDHFIAANRTPSEWLLTVALSGFVTLVAIDLAGLLVRWVDGMGPLVLPASVKDSWRARARGRAQWLGLARIVILSAIAIMNVLLVFDARYRDFPSLLFAPVIAGFALLTACVASGAARPAYEGLEVEERILYAWLIASSLLIVAMELPTNLAADLWAMLCIILALSVGGLGPLRRGVRFSSR